MQIETTIPLIPEMAAKWTAADPQTRAEEQARIRRAAKKVARGQGCNAVALTLEGEIVDRFTV